MAATFESIRALLQKLVPAGTIALFACALYVNAQNNFLGEIKIFAGNFAPTGWAFCDGTLIPEHGAFFASGHNLRR